MKEQSRGGNRVSVQREHALFGHGRRVLVAEDDEYMRSLIAMLLRVDGFEVIEAKDGAELFDEIAPWLEHPPGWALPDLVISDIRMPRIDGLEVLAALAGTEIAPPVVLITAMGDPETREQASRYGAAAILNKPFELTELRSLVKDITSQLAS